MRASRSRSLPQRVARGEEVQVGNSVAEGEGEGEDEFWSAVNPESMEVRDASGNLLDW